MSLLGRDTVEAFYAAYVSRDADRIAPFLDEESIWMFAGPIDVLPYCGRYRGKAVLLDLFRTTIPKVMKIVGYDRHECLVDGDRVATHARLTAILIGTNRTISCHVAQFLRFRDGKVIELWAMIDSFDAVEQMLGHRLEITQALAPKLAPTVTDDLFVI